MSPYHCKICGALLRVSKPHTKQRILNIIYEHYQEKHPEKLTEKWINAQKARQSAAGSGTPKTSSRKESNMKKGSAEAKAWGAKMRRARNAGTTKRKTSTKTVSSKKTKRRASTASRTEYIT